MPLWVWYEASSLDADSKTRESGAVGGVPCEGASVSEGTVATSIA